jgi:ATP-dependent DNA helicase RecG
VESHCVLLYQSPLSKTANKRLTVLRKSNDGFYIAQQDLNIRGPGELLGSRQTGLVDMRIADLVRDQALIPQAQQLAEHIWQHHPDQAKALMHRWLPNKEALGHA